MNKSNLLTILERISTNAIVNYNLTDAEREAIRAAVAELKTDLRKEANKNNVNIDKVYNALMKFNAKNYNFNRFNGCWIDSGNKYFTDCYSVFEVPTDFESDILSVPPVRLGKRAFDENANTAGINETLPTLSELKAELKERKAAAKLDGVKKAKIIYKTESGIAFNVEFLINAIEGTGTNIIHVINKTAPALFTGEKSRCLLCPINVINKPVGYSVIGC